MSKMFNVLFSIVFLFVMFVTPVMASPNGNGQNGNVTVTGDYDASPWAKDFSFDYEHDYFGGGIAFAYGTVMTGGELHTYANSTSFRLWKLYVPAFAFQTGCITAGSEVDTWAWVKNKPFKASAGAGAKFEDGYVFMSGLAVGLRGDQEEIYSRVKFGGELTQMNGVQKDAFGSHVFAGNKSGLKFEAYMPTQSSYANGMVVHMNGTTYTPDAITVGRSSVTVDPFGATRSITGHTENMTRVEFSPCYRPASLDSSVYGFGVTGGYVNGIGNTYASGVSSFGYNGYTVGAGEANIKATVSNVGNTATATVHGSSWAITNGNTNNYEQPK